jgi:hypothetical protein
VCHKYVSGIANDDEEYIMAWSEKTGELAEQDWHARSAKKRAELSMSIEEALANDLLVEDPFVDELEEFAQKSNSAVIIPPRLSLQSKPMPVVFVKTDEACKVTLADSAAATDSVEDTRTMQKKRRLAGRTTKVHLQAVSKAQKKTDGKISIETEQNVRSVDGEVHTSIKNNSKRSTRSGAGGQVKSTVQASLAGSGLFKQGQNEVMIVNDHIAMSSVVLVTLVRDPGPVVVKYISLQPQVGFTIHLSAQAAAETPFNYVILMGEVF